MSFKDIQERMAAAFAATGAAPTSAPASAVVAPTFSPSPFQPTAFVPPAAAPAAPPAFQFVPPPNAATPPNGGPWSPINPPGERVALGAPAFTPTPAQVVESVAASVGAVIAAVTEPPKRKRRTKAEMAAAEKAASLADELLNEQAQAMFDPSNAADHVARDLNAAHPELSELKDLPADGSTVEDIVEELFARGVTQVNLTFTKDGMR